LETKGIGITSMSSCDQSDDLHNAYTISYTSKSISDPGGADSTLTEPSLPHWVGLK
jgi:hypothetical protein